MSFNNFLRFLKDDSSKGVNDITKVKAHLISVTLWELNICFT